MLQNTPHPCICTAIVPAAHEPETDFMVHPLARQLLEAADGANGTFVSAGPLGPPWLSRSDVPTLAGKRPEWGGVPRAFGTVPKRTGGLGLNIQCRETAACKCSWRATDYFGICGHAARIPSHEAPRMTCQSVRPWGATVVARWELSSGAAAHGDKALAASNCSSAGADQRCAVQRQSCVSPSPVTYCARACAWGAIKLATISGLAGLQPAAMWVGAAFAPEKQIERMC